MPRKNRSKIKPKKVRALTMPHCFNYIVNTLDNFKIISRSASNSSHHLENITKQFTGVDFWSYVYTSGIIEHN